MELRWQLLNLAAATPFRTAKATRTNKQTVWVQVSHEGIEGWGEAVPMDTYHQTRESAESTLQQIRDQVVLDPHHADTTIADLAARFPNQLASVAAIDAALHDWLGKRYGIPTVHWLGLDPSRAPLTSFTLGMDEPQRLREKVQEAHSYPVLKVKVDADRAVETVALIREAAPSKIVRIDANTSWTTTQAEAVLPRLARYQVEFVEQPLPADDHDGLRYITSLRICPIVADESSIVPADVVTLAGCVDGINIKLGKCGGIRQAIRMIHLARGFGMKVMLGCMMESSLGIASAAQLAPMADWLDLDGHLLLASDPFTGLGGEKGRLTIGGSSGLGVTRSPASAASDTFV